METRKKDELAEVPEELSSGRGVAASGKAGVDLWKSPSAVDTAGDNTKEDGINEVPGQPGNRRETAGMVRTRIGRAVAARSRGGVPDTVWDSSNKDWIDEVLGEPVDDSDRARVADLLAKGRSRIRARGMENKDADKKA